MARLIQAETAIVRARSEPSRSTRSLHVAFDLGTRSARSATWTRWVESRGHRWTTTLVSAWINLAIALSQKGDLVEARRALERAQKLDPSDPRVRATSTSCASSRRKVGRRQARRGE